MPSGATLAARTNTTGTTIPVVAHPDAIKKFPGLPAFVVGVWYQPRSSWQKWKDRGINTLVGLELEGAERTEAAKAALVKAAHDMQLAVIGDSPDADAILNPPDEPDGVGNVSPDVFVSQYASIKATSPAKPIFGNFDGEKTRWRPTVDYLHYFQGCDIIALDFYPVNGGWITTGGMDLYRQRIDWVMQNAGGKPVFITIECSDQNLRVQPWLHTPENQPQGEQRAAAMRAPSPDEVELEVSIAVAKGAKGIFYFPDRIGLNWEAFDTTPADVATRMTAINKKLTTVVTPPAPVTPFAWPAVFCPTPGVIYDRR